MAGVLVAEIYLICMLIVAMLLFWAKKSASRSASDIWLRRFMLWFLLNFASNFMFAVVNYVRLINAIVVPASYLFKSVYFVTLCVGVYSWIGYAETELGSKFFYTKKTLIVSIALLAIPVLVVVVNLWTHLLFSVDEDGFYKKGMMFHYIMGFLVVGIIVTATRVFMRSNHESDPNNRRHMRLLGTFPICIVAAWMLSVADDRYPIVSVVIALELLIIFMGNSTQQISLDKLTQVNNRQNLIAFLEYKFRTHENRLYVLLMDVDYFKQINDKYGHLEGDAALIRVASALKKSCSPYKKRPYIARYGGDEFVIVLEATEEEVKILRDNIHKTLKEMNEAHGSEYELKVSIGMAEYDYGMDYKEFIEKADNELYKIKQARPKQPAK